MRADLVAIARRVVAGHASVEDLLAERRVAVGMRGKNIGEEKNTGEGKDFGDRFPGAV